MSYRTAFGIIDPNGYLASGQAEEYISGHTLDERKVATINQAIADWAERDPEGYSDAEARKLDAKVQGVLRNEK